VQVEHLFVYGTLRRALGAPVHAPLARDGRNLGEGRFQGLLFEVDGYPGAIDSPSSQHVVLGEVYASTAMRRLLAALDGYEECSPAFPPPHEYVRRRRAITLADGDRVEAWIYLYNHDPAGLHRVASGDYLQFRRERHAQPVNHAP
jgi:gamma-glutamylcyclotransferase (GGCT)/AIG2-like uncharacterized protein YtfP